MKIDILTIFPEMFIPILRTSMLKIAQEKGLVKIQVHNLRKWSKDKHKKVDDRPFGGGPGMVMKIEPIYFALIDIVGNHFPRSKDASSENNQRTEIILLSPQGEKFTQLTAKRLSHYGHLVLICGHYEGIDERVRLYLVDEEISIGDYILTCGELPAMVVIDAVVRLIPGVLGSLDSLQEESFSSGLLEYPQFTRPADFQGWKVPSILLSGDHKKIEEWRREEAVKLTREKRPDLWKKMKRKK
ncbi:MAG: tRNA (guanosine(37)-N1)-methyltransferase TrmD [Candidatus Omnitrophica bacterium]|nr:tRNA (guanosine(37)-N1)-methyltransferase TrmD [Candidatus Omnitrophota bacterium]MCM8793363.1 tRNA (guanosine(37)-N1)-methyltransferase TrmD [Candidatus Omnitrophota bacterium]